MNKLPFDPEIAQGCTSRHIPESPVPRLNNSQAEKKIIHLRRVGKKAKHKQKTFSVLFWRLLRADVKLAIVGLLTVNKKAFCTKKKESEEEKCWSVLVVDRFFFRDPAKRTKESKKTRRKRVFSDSMIQTNSGRWINIVCERMMMLHAFHYWKMRLTRWRFVS